jgi:hypothetical protein
MSDVRINTRSPYYINADRGEREPVTIPDPVENNTPPTVTLTASNENPYLGETVTLTATASDSDGTIVSYTWGGAATGSPAQAVVTVTKAANANPVTETYVVTVEDDDGDTAIAYVQLNWQLPLPIGEIDDIDVNCGETISYSNLTGQQVFNLKPFDKIGNVEVEFLTPSVGEYDIPVKFDIEWNGNTATTGYIGSNTYDSDLQDQGVASGDISTAATSNKKAGTSLIINKTAATPQEVTLTANSVLGNDYFKFILNCPNVTSTDTFFHTLTSTCVGGDTVFTYTDVNGDSQTITVPEGETKLVSAQENTPVATTCTGTVEKGGTSFDLGRPELTVTKRTEFNVFLDESGSLGDTIPILQSAVEELKTDFYEFYDRSDEELSKRFRYFDKDDERFLTWMATTKRNADTTNVVNIILVDEAETAYHTKKITEVNASNAIDFVGSRFAGDLSTLRTALDSVSYGGVLNVVLCVERAYANDFYKTYTFYQNQNVAASFSFFIDNISEGKNGHHGSNGLSDRSEVVFSRGLPVRESASYYKDKILTELRALGYVI